MFTMELLFSPYKCVLYFSFFILIRNMTYSNGLPTQRSKTMIHTPAMQSHFSNMLVDVTGTYHHFSDDDNEKMDIHQPFEYVTDVVEDDVDKGAIGDTDTIEDNKVPQTIQEVQKRMSGGTSSIESRKNKKKMPVLNYIWRLFSAMENEDNLIQLPEQKIEDINVPTIHTYRGNIVISKQQREQVVFSFKMPLVENTSRAEIVLDRKHNSELMLAIKAFIKIYDQEVGKTFVFESIPLDRYFIFDISSIKNKIQHHLIVHIDLLIGNSSVKITKRNAPLLAIYTNLKENPLLKKPSISRRKRQSTEHMSRFLSQGSDSYDNYHCKRYDWDIDMRSFDWPWYAWPIVYNAGFCKGVCPVLLDSEILNSTSYSFIKNLWRSVNYFSDSAVPEACCTPIKFYSQSIFYENENEETIMQTLPNMKVAACGCR